MMNIQRHLMRLYPPRWRERYEDEMLAMLEQQQALSFTDNMNLFLGALDAQLHPHLSTAGMAVYERILAMFVTLRSSLIIIFCAFVGFVLAGWAFQKMTEYHNFTEAAQNSNIIGLSFNLVVIGAIVAFLAVLIGALPIVMAIIKSALAQKLPGTLLLLTVPILALTIFLGSTPMLKALLSGNQLSLFISRGIFFGILIIAAIASVGALCFAVVRSEIPEKFLRFAMLPSILVTVSMGLVSVATIIWGFGLHDASPRLFASNDGILGSSTTGTWLAIVIAMSIATVLAVISLLRGLSARSALQNTLA